MAVRSAPLGHHLIPVKVRDAIQPHPARVEAQHVRCLAQREQTVSNRRCVSF